MKKSLTVLYVVVSLCLATLAMTHLIPVFRSLNEKVEPVFQKGMSYRHLPYPYNSSESDESLLRMKETNVGHVAIIAWWFQENSSSTQIYPHFDFTPTNESLKHAIQMAHNLSMKVMLKPMIDTEDAINDPRWKIKGTAEWFKSYKAFMCSYAQFAQENDVDLLCIGCEFKTTELNTTTWREIISEVRKYYSGPLTYAATIDSYQDVLWWDSLDYVGIDAYFPLTRKNDPTLEELKQAWNRIANDLESWHLKVKKPILFTEIGYRSGDGNNMEPWNWTATLELDLQEQFDCYLAALLTLWDKTWFYGFYWWIWESDPKAGGPNDTDFTPQNKPVQYLIRSWYSSERHIDPCYELKQKYLMYAFVATTMAFSNKTAHYVRKSQIKRI
ncbi:MAG: hypothetical protein AOA65_2112 [Candidatus Bathyarchaeota archaeon BA1]|nr:MAG: hypothetical protein AOA65_2112 [Candidatus Bathyarchaeota archaeon BA1]